MAGINEFIENSRKYAEEKGFKLNPDTEALQRLARGVLENERRHGKRYCPCRRVSGNPEEDANKICPCVFHLKEIEKNGHCLCNLYFKK